jgi:asparagine synthase (glutamine-hydrolysing)
MCGLTAILAVKQPDPSETTHPKKTLEEEIDQSLEAVKHRGPDARGQWISPDRRVGEFAFIYPLRTYFHR